MRKRGRLSLRVVPAGDRHPGEGGGGHLSAETRREEFAVRRGIRAFDSMVTF